MSGNLKVHVGEGFDAVASRVIDAWHRAERGEVVGENHLSFESWEGLSKVMSGKRLELLRHLHRMPAAGVSALTRALGRDEKSVRDDVETLVAAGLIERAEDGRLSAEYDEIRTVIAL